MLSPNSISVKMTVSTELFPHKHFTFNHKAIPFDVPYVTFWNIKKIGAQKFMVRPKSRYFRLVCLMFINARLKYFSTSESLLSLEKIKIDFVFCSLPSSWIRERNTSENNKKKIQRISTMSAFCCHNFSRFFSAPTRLLDLHSYEGINILSPSYSAWSYCRTRDEK